MLTKACRAILIVCEPASNQLPPRTGFTRYEDWNLSARLSPPGPGLVMGGFEVEGIAGLIKNENRPLAQNLTYRVRRTNDFLEHRRRMDLPGSIDRNERMRLDARSGRRGHRRSSKMHITGSSSPSVCEMTAYYYSICGMRRKSYYGR